MPAKEVNELDAIKTAMDALQPLDEEGRRRALSYISDRLSIPTGALGAGSIGGQATPRVQDVPGDLKTMEPKAFLAAKNPQTDVERATVLAYYLTHARGERHFKTRDLTDLNTEAAGQRFSNTSVAVNNAIRQNGYLAPGPKGTRQITARGDEVVEALPDREALAAILAAQPKRRRRKRTTNKTAKSRTSSPKAG
jgi:hypothetical protein